MRNDLKNVKEGEDKENVLKENNEKTNLKNIF